MFIQVQIYKLAKLSRKEVPDHRQAKRQARNQDETYPDFPRQNYPGGVRVPCKRTLFAGG